MTQEVDQLVSDLQSGDPPRENAAVDALEAIGGARAIVILAGSLDRKTWRQSKGFDPAKRGPHGELPQGRVVYEPVSYMAAKALSRMVPNPPPGHDQDPITDEVIKRWKQWWSENRSRYEAQ